MIKKRLAALRSRLSRSIRLQRSLLLVAIIGIGIATLMLSKAAGTTVSLQPESGTKCNANLQQSTVAGASGNAYIKFATNVCSSGTLGGEDVRGVVAQAWPDGTYGLPNIPTNPASLITDWTQTSTQTMQPGGEGAFRFRCMPGQLLYDDPIVKPGRPGQTHLHLFYGNDTANANSTYASLRQNGTGTCEGGPINRSSYWMPALISGADNKVVLPNYVQVYYKVQIARINALNYIPRGLRMIAGNPMDSGATEAQVYGPANASVPGGYYRSPIWHCWMPNESPARWRDGTESDRIPTNCQDGDILQVDVPFPFCWSNNRYLDSNDHRTHVVFPDNYEENCPNDHSIRIPEFSIHVLWPLRPGDAAKMSTWYLSSDKHGGANYPNGKSMHADWFGAWDEPKSKLWIDTCLKGGLSCFGGNFGNLTTGKRPTPYYDDTNYIQNYLVNIPPMP